MPESILRTHRQSKSACTSGGVDIRPIPETDHLLYQLQRMMVGLRFSCRRAYNPEHWCYAFKGPDGKPTKTGLQQDAQEYLSSLVDRLRVQLKGCSNGAAQHMLENMFLGKLANQRFIGSSDSFKCREDDQPFHCIQLGVSNTLNSLRRASNICVTVSSFQIIEMTMEICAPW